MFTKLKTKQTLMVYGLNYIWERWSFWTLDCCCCYCWYFFFNLEVFNLTSVTKGNWYEIGINYHSIGFHRKEKFKTVFIDYKQQAIVNFHWSKSPPMCVVSFHLDQSSFNLFHTLFNRLLTHCFQFSLFWDVNKINFWY